jgi:hypothetical protein
MKVDVRLFRRQLSIAIGVRNVPGITAFARMPKAAYSVVSCRVRALMPPLVAA